LSPESDDQKQTLAAGQVSGMVRTGQGCGRHAVTALSRRPPQGLPRHVKGASPPATRLSAGRRPLDVTWLGYARSTGERGRPPVRRRRRAHHSEAAKMGLVRTLLWVTLLRAFGCRRNPLSEQIRHAPGLYYSFAGFADGIIRVCPTTDFGT
jgi:hypothetical protein